MSFCSFASLLGADCGASCENPNVVDFVESKDCTRDVTAQGCSMNWVQINIRVNEDLDI